MKKIETTHDIQELFPQTVEQIDHLGQQAINRTRTALDELFAVPEKERTFENTALFLDRLTGAFSQYSTIFHVIEAVHTDELMRNAAHHNLLKLNAFAVDNLSQNKKLYTLFKHYSQNQAPHEKLSSERIYFIEEELKAFEQNGLHLEEHTRERLKNIKKELGEHMLSFERNISSDTRVITVDQDALAGLSEEFIAGLHRAEDGKYILGVDYPTYFCVMENCSVEATRAALWHEFVNRAYPANQEELALIIALRDEFAKKVGYESFAHLDISTQMAKSPERVDKFLHELGKCCHTKVQQEMELLKTHLPQGVTLSQDNKLKPWDVAYIKACYKKKYLSVNEAEIAQYFPLEHTLDKLLYIYQEFFGLKFKKLKAPELWDTNIEYIQVFKQDKFIGSLLLDLFPRPNKFTHACNITIVPTIETAEGSFYPALSLVIANFPWPTHDQPALLRRSDVSTFFHEFGHALHGLLGTTELIAFSGVHVKRDFVELPSQILEEWLWDKEILKLVSSHYQTHEPLSDDLIAHILALKHFDSGHWIQRQIYYSLLSLDLYKSGAYKDIYALQQNLLSNLLPYIQLESHCHDYASFGHLTGYAAKYYGYLWSKVFALDIFEHIKQYGLLNYEIGQKYSNIILAKGGSVEPEELLRNFLGRDPNLNAFFKQLGL